jgi:hypothetical protein
MNSLLDELHSYAVMLNKLGMLQAAGDYDYLASWLRSVDLSNPSGHFGVIPAGKDTVAPRANNCPIPFTASIDLIRLCKNNQWAIGCLTAIYNILTELKKTYTSSHESLALKCFSKYTSEIAVLLGGEPIEPPGPEPPIIEPVSLFVALNKATGENITCYTGNIPEVSALSKLSNVTINSRLLRDNLTSHAMPSIGHIAHSSESTVNSKDIYLIDFSHNSVINIEPISKS